MQISLLHKCLLGVHDIGICSLLVFHEILQPSSAYPVNRIFLFTIVKTGV